MNINITNQSPTDFTTLTPKISHFDTDLDTEINTTIAEPFTKALFTPLQAGQPVHLQIDQTVYTDDKIKQLITESLTSNDVKIQINDQLAVLLHQASRYRDTTPQAWQQIIANSLLIKNKAPLPTPTLIYTYDKDVQNAAKDVLQSMQKSNQPDPALTKELEIALLGNLLPNPITQRWSIILTNNTDYQQIQNSLQNLAANSQTLTTDVRNNITQAMQIKLSDKDVFTSWVTGSNNEPSSFNRVVNYILNQIPNLTYTKILPINLQAMINPIGFSFINIESLANSDGKRYHKELTTLQQLTNRLVKFHVTKLSKIQSAQAIQQQINNTKNRQQKQYSKDPSGDRATRKQRGFHKTLPSAQLQLDQLIKIVNHHISTMISDNTYKKIRTTFMRPNRRHPNDPNLRGHIQTTKYRPDIHIFLDCSGSISESQYRTGVTFLIKIAKKLHTNLYFTSFSNEITQPVKLKTKNATVKQIYRQIQAIPKAYGGTEYENVWNMVDVLEKQNQKFHKAPQLNFMITDFEYDLRASWSPRLKQASTKMLYYLPLAADQDDYDYCRRYGMEFANELIDAGDLNIKDRILMWSSQRRLTSLCHTTWSTLLITILLTITALTKTILKIQLILFQPCQFNKPLAKIKFQNP